MWSALARQRFPFAGERFRFDCDFPRQTQKLRRAAALQTSSRVPNAPSGILLQYDAKTAREQPLADARGTVPIIWLCRTDQE